MKNSEAASCEPHPLTQDNRKNQNNFTRRSYFDGLFSATFFLTSASALLYVFGYIYQTSYLDTWGVDADLFSLPIQQYLVYGGSVFASIGVSGGLIWLVIIGGLLICAYLLNYIVGSIKVPNSFMSFWRRTSSNNNRETNVIPLFKSGLVELLLIFLIILTIVLISYSFFNLTQLVTRTGESVAKNMMESLSKKQIGYSLNGFSKIKRFETELKSFNAFVIAANDKFYALYIPALEDRQHHLLTIPTVSILSVTAEAKQLQSKLPVLKPSPQKIR